MIQNWIRERQVSYYNQFTSRVRLLYAFIVVKDENYSVSSQSLGKFIFTPQNLEPYAINFQEGFQMTPFSGSVCDSSYICTCRTQLNIYMISKVYIRNSYLLFDHLANLLVGISLFLPLTNTTQGCFLYKLGKFD